MGFVVIIPPGMENDPKYYIPHYDKAVELQPNYFCRARNTKREKYCRARSGQGTDHLGQGRCRNHGGSTPIAHGRYSDVVRGSVGEHIDRLELETEKEKMDVLPEATFMRALVLDTAEKWEEFRDALIAWNDAEAQDAAVEERRPKFIRVPELAELADIMKKTAEVVNMVHKQRTANAITMPDFYRLMAAMAEVVGSEIDKLERFVDPAKLDVTKLNIQKAWKEIKMKA